MSRGAQANSELCWIFDLLRVDFRGDISGHSPRFLQVNSGSIRWRMVSGGGIRFLCDMFYAALLHSGRGEEASGPLLPIG